MVSSPAAGKHVLNLLRLSRFPIYHQLLLEEALLRNTKQNWVLLNDGAFQPAIVLGISGKPQELVHIPAAQHAGIQVIKRFTGGGTVVVDNDTIFTSLIFQGDALPHVQCYPQPIMKWTEEFYQQVFRNMQVDGQGFALRENDYVFGEHKFGGNAQAITGRRWLHHTSLLWRYQPQRMALLTQPRKAPAYRQGREHRSFLVPLKDVMRRAAHVDSLADPWTSPPHQQHQIDQLSDRDHPRHGQAVGMHGAAGQQHEAQMGTRHCSGVSGGAMDGEGQEHEAELRAQLLERFVEAAHRLDGFEVQERTIGEASQALRGTGTCGTKLVDLSAFNTAEEPHVTSP